MTTPHQEQSPQPSPRASVNTPQGFGYSLWVAGLLGNLHDAGFAVDTCVAGQEQDSLFSSQLTRQQVLQCLKVMIQSAEDLPPAIKALMPGIDWPAFRLVKPQLMARSAQERDELWTSMTTLVPVTLRALNRYRKHRPELFSFNPAY